VVAAYGSRLLVEDPGGDRHDCLVASKRLRAVIGDEVEWRPATARGEAVVCAVGPRQNELVRPDRRGRREVLAANLDQLIVVVAPTPKPDPFIVDRYLAAAEYMQARGMVLLNKCELLEDEADGAALLEEYARLGYATLQVSARTGTGLERLASLLAGHVSIFAGQSGVGKSSLLNALLPGLELHTDEVSAALGEGRHTTTSSTLYRLANGGEVIDSPGVRDYAPGDIASGEDAQKAFIEIAAAAAHCRFHNCRHLREPGCAVKAAVETGEISARRYESYRRLRRLKEQLTPDY
jgi:ribosome biogenesis GTPase